MSLLNQFSNLLSCEVHYKLEALCIKSKELARVARAHTRIRDVKGHQGEVRSCTKT